MTRLCGLKDIAVILATCGSLLLLSSCGIKGGVTSKLPSNAELDQEASSVGSPSTRGVADGTTPTIVKITLIKKNGAPITGFQPILTVIGPGTNIATCSTSDQHGESICHITSDTAGTKAIQVSNASIKAIGAVIFESVSSSISTGVGTAPANGQTPATITINLIDSNNQPIVGTVPHLAISGDPNATVQCQPSNASGQSVCTILSKVPGTKTITVTDPPISGSVQVDFESPRIAIQDGRAQTGGGVPSSSPDAGAAIVTIEVRDASGTLSPGVTPQLTITGPGNNQYSCSPANSQGLSTCRITSDVSGDRVVTVTGPSGYEVSDESIKITFAPAAATVTAPTATTPVLANNSSEVMIEVTLKNDSNSAIVGVVPHVIVEGSGTNQVRCEESNALGVAHCYIRSDSPGVKTVIVQDPPVSDPVNVTFESSPVVASQPLVPASATSPAVITVTLPGGAAAAGTTPVLTTHPSSATTQCTPANSSGVATCFVVSESSGSYEVSVTSPASVSQTVSVGFSDTQSILELVTKDAVANGSAAAVVRLTLKTSAGLPRIGVVPALDITGNGATPYSCSSSSLTGVSDCSLTSTAFGEKAVHATSPLIQQSVRVNFTDAGASISTGASSLTAIANGTGSSATIVIDLVDGNGNPRVGVTPELAITGSGAITYTCLPSNALGQATCTITANQAGAKTVQVTYPPMESVTTVNFNSNIAACPITNGTGSKNWAGPLVTDFGPCTVVSCNLNYTISGNACAANSRACSPMPVGALVCSETWNGTTWVSQTTSSCKPNYTLTSNVCVADTRACDVLPVHFASGTQTWNGTAWAACVATSCDYRYKVGSGTCIAADVTPNAVTIADVNGVEINTEVVSDPVTISGIDVPIQVSASGGTNSRLETKRGTGAWTDRSANYNDVQAGDLLRIATTSSGTVLTPTVVAVHLGDLAVINWTVTTSSSVSPTGASLVHTSGARSFTLSWNGDGIGNGNCHAQYLKDDLTWTNLSGTFDCDQAATNQNVGLPTTSAWTNNFNAGGVSVRLVRDSDATTVTTFAQKLTCAPQTLPSTETPDIDETCDGDWSNDADLSAPTGASFTIDSGSASTGVVGVTLDVTCPTDPTAPVEMAFGDTATPTNWTACSSTATHNLIPGTGSKTVFMRFRDGYGNTTTAYSQSIFLDTSAPAGGAFTINSAATQTNDGNVTLNVTCPTDDNATIEVAYGNAANPTNWTTCAASLSHSLVAGSGNKTVYARFRDGHNNVTADLTQTILLDTDVPTMSLSYSSGWITTSTLAITVTGADSHSGVASCELEVATASIASGTVGAFGGYVSVPAASSSSGDGCGTYDLSMSDAVAYIYRARATDNLNQQSTWSVGSQAWVDTTPPTGAEPTYANGLQTSTSISVSVTSGSDTDSGMSSNAADYLLEVASATFSGGTCGAFGSYADAGVNEVAGATSYSYTGTSGFCHRFRYQSRNTAGLSSVVDSPNVVKIDGSAPSGGSVSYPSVLASTSVTVNVNRGSDGDSGMSSVAADYLLEVASATLSGGTCGTYSSFADAGVSETPAATSYIYTGADNTCFKFRYTVANTAGLTTTYTSTTELKVDTTAASGGSISVPASVTGSSLTVTVDRGTDAHSGMSSTASDYLLEVATAPLTSGTCGTYGSYADAGVTETAAATSYTYSSVTYSNCYKFRYTVKNGIGTATTYEVATPTQRAQDTLPDAFTIASQTDVAFSGDISSANVNLTGFEGTVSLTFSGNTSNAAYSTNGGSSWTTISSGHTITPTSQFRVRQRSSSSPNTTTTLTVTVGTGSAVNFSVTTMLGVAPTSMSLTHSSRSKSFSASWSGSQNFANCVIQNWDGGSWQTIQSVTCDSGSGSYTLSSVGSNWDGRQVRLAANNGSVAIATFSQTLSCSPVGGSSTPTPNTDENCNGSWDDATYSGGLYWKFMGGSYQRYQTGNNVGTSNEGCSTPGQYSYSGGWYNSGTATDGGKHVPVYDNIYVIPENTDADWYSTWLCGTSDITFY